MKRRTIMAMAIVLALTGGLLADDLVMFHYQGKVKVQGQPFNGTGLFKFAIVNNPGTVSLWSNDGTSVNGNQPVASISVSVTEGIFNVMIGDPALGMEPINRSIFNHPSQIKLRTWFSDGVHGFQQLLPDRRIINPKLIGIISGDQDFTIYVNGTTGNDENSGLTPEEAKKTIQAAVDVLPDRLHCNVTIDIADGIYREEVKVFGITVEEGKALTFLGDESWTPSSPGDPAVRITGCDEDVSHLKVRDNAFFSRQSSVITINGILFDYAEYAGFHLREGTYRLMNCKAAHNGKYGFCFSGGGFGFVDDCLAEYNTIDGFLVSNFSGPILTSCEALHNGEIGISIEITSTVSFYGTCEFSSNAHHGIRVACHSRAFFKDTYTGQLNNNGQYGLYIRWDSFTQNHTVNSFSDNGTGAIYTGDGGHTY